MLVVGSTLEVWPVAGLPLEARSSRSSTAARRRSTTGALLEDRRGRRGRLDALLAELGYARSSLALGFRCDGVLSAQRDRVPARSLRRSMADTHECVPLVLGAPVKVFVTRVADARRRVLQRLSVLPVGTGRTAVTDLVTRRRAAKNGAGSTRWGTRVADSRWRSRR